MVWFMYQTLNAVFHSFLNKFQRDSGCLRENLSRADKQKCFLWVLLSNNAGFPGASHPTCSASSSLGLEPGQHCPSRTFSILPAEPSLSLPWQSSWPRAGLASWLWLPAGTCLSPQQSHQPRPLIPAPPPALPGTPTPPYRQFNSRAGLYLQTYTKDLNFNIILLSDLQRRFWLQYFALSTGTKQCVPAVA